MKNLKKICDNSYDQRTGGCDCVSCKYHIKHYQPEPKDWFIFHKVTAVNAGECLQQGGTQNG